MARGIRGSNDTVHAGDGNDIFRIGGAVECRRQWRHGQRRRGPQRRLL